MSKTNKWVEFFVILAAIFVCGVTVFLYKMNDDSIEELFDAQFIEQRKIVNNLIDMTEDGDLQWGLDECYSKGSYGMGHVATTGQIS